MIPLQPLGKGCPADGRLAVQLRDVPELVLMGRKAKLARCLGSDEHESGNRLTLGRLEGEQATHPVADHDHPGAEPCDDRGDILDEHLEGQLGRVRGLAPMMISQVKGMALPAPSREVAEVALPEPRTPEFPMHEQEGFAARPAFG